MLRLLALLLTPPLHLLAADVHKLVDGLLLGLPVQDIQQEVDLGCAAERGRLAAGAGCLMLPE